MALKGWSCKDTSLVLICICSLNVRVDNDFIALDRQTVLQMCATLLLFTTNQRWLKSHADDIWCGGDYMCLLLTNLLPALWYPVLAWEYHLVKYLWPQTEDKCLLDRQCPIEWTVSESGGGAINGAIEREEKCKTTIRLFDAFLLLKSVCQWPSLNEVRKKVMWKKIWWTMANYTLQVLVTSLSISHYPLTGDSLWKWKIRR